VAAEPIRAVLYDYGNVIVGWDPGRLYSRVIPDPDRRARFLEDVCPMSWHLLHDRGHAMAETIPARQALFPEFAAEIAMWRTHFADMISGPIPGTVALIETLAGVGTPQYVLTNMPDEMVGVCFEPYDLERHFKDVIVSGRERVAKPDPEIFKISLRRMGGLPAGSVLFADDSPANIAAAAAMGFQTCLFENPIDGPLALRAAMAEGGLPV
jgi:2-haloacid dehalogenase/putative hydrolase of the HAD superfamily